MIKQVRHLLENFSQEPDQQTESAEGNGFAASPAFVKRTMRSGISSHTTTPCCHIQLDDVENEAVMIASDFLVQNGFPLSFALNAARRCVDQDLTTFLANAVSKKVNADHEYSGNVDERKEEDEEMGVDASALTKCVRNSIRAYCRTLLNDKNLNTFFDQSVPKPPYEWSAHAVRNSRRKMEDRHVILPNVAWLYPKVPKADQTEAFAVYDGHGGQECAEYVRSHAFYNVFHSLAYPDDVCQALQDGFNTTDSRLLKYCERESRQSGTTAVSAIINDETVYVAWAGDSRALIVGRNDIRKLTDPLHDTKNKIEVDRVLEAGGLVFNFQGQDRVNGLLNITRSLGDLALKPTPLTAHPEVIKASLTASDMCLVLASDGLFDGHTWEEVGEMVREYLKAHGVEEYPNIAKHMADAACNKTTDNVTVIVVFLQPMERLKERFH